MTHEKLGHSEGPRAFEILRSWWWEPGMSIMCMRAQVNVTLGRLLLLLANSLSSSRCASKWTEIKTIKNTSEEKNQDSKSRKFTNRCSASHKFLHDALCSPNHCCRVVFLILVLKPSKCLLAVGFLLFLALEGALVPGLPCCCHEHFSVGSRRMWRKEHAQPFAEFCSRKTKFKKRKRRGFLKNRSNLMKCSRENGFISSRKAQLLCHARNAYHAFLTVAPVLNQRRRYLRQRHARIFLLESKIHRFKK